MLKSGLSSKTLKNLSIDHIIKVAKEANFDGIEWDSSHVPSGDLEKAEDVAKLTIKAGLRVLGYASDINVGMDSRNFEKFKNVFMTAKALKSPIIILYAGKTKPKYATDDFIKKLILETKIFAGYVKKERMIIAFEFEENTLTETNESTLNLIEKINHENVWVHWKPSQGMAIKERLDGLKKLVPHICCVRASYSLGSTLFPLITGYNEWTKYIDVLKRGEKEIYLLIDRVKNSEVHQFFLDAKVLKDLIK